MTANWGWPLTNATYVQRLVVAYITLDDVHVVLLAQLGLNIGLGRFDVANEPDGCVGCVAANLVQELKLSGRLASGSLYHGLKSQWHLRRGPWKLQ